MKLGRIVSFAFCWAAFAQTTEPSKEVEQALRTRVEAFYQASVTGKFKQALLLVTDDSVDHYLQKGSSKFDSCETVKITFASDLTSANVLEKCQGEVRFRGLTQHPSFPITSRWKIVDGQWFWYWAEPTEAVTPFGVSKITSDPTRGVTPQVPDGKKVATGMYDSIKLDRATVNLSTSRVSEDTIYLTNGLPGSISLSLPTLNQPGLRIEADKLDVDAGEKVGIVFKYDVNDPAIACMDCLKKLHGPVSAVLRIIPTGQIFPISINFVNSEK